MFWNSQQAGSALQGGSPWTPEQYANAQPMGKGWNMPNSFFNRGPSMSNPGQPPIGAGGAISSGPMQPAPAMGSFTVQGGLAGMFPGYRFGNLMQTYPQGSGPGGAFGGVNPYPNQQPQLPNWLQSMWGVGGNGSQMPPNNPWDSRPNTGQPGTINGELQPQPSIYNPGFKYGANPLAPTGPGGPGGPGAGGNPADLMKAMNNYQQHQNTLSQMYDGLGNQAYGGNYNDLVDWFGKDQDAMSAWANGSSRPAYPGNSMGGY